MSKSTHRAMLLREPVVEDVAAGGGVIVHLRVHACKECMSHTTYRNYSCACDAKQTHPASWRARRRSRTAGCCCPRAAVQVHTLHRLVSHAGRQRWIARHFEKQDLSATFICKGLQMHAPVRHISYSVPLPTLPCFMAYITFGFKSAPGASPKTCTNTPVTGCDWCDIVRPKFQEDRGLGWRITGSGVHTRAWYRFLALTLPCLSRSDVFPSVWSCKWVHTSVARSVSQGTGRLSLQTCGLLDLELQTPATYKHANDCSKNAQHSSPKLKQSAAHRLLAVAYEGDLLSPVEAAHKSKYLSTGPVLSRE